MNQYRADVTADLDGPLYSPEVGTDFSGTSGSRNETFVGLSAIGHDYDMWVGCEA